MKKYILLVIILLITTCQPAENNQQNPAPIDSIKLLQEQTLHLQLLIELRSDSIKHLTDSIVLLQSRVKELEADTIMSAECFVAQYKLERIKYYMNIANKNPSQRQFLRGWINRVLNE